MCERSHFTWLKANSTQPNSLMHNNSTNNNNYWNEVGGLVWRPPHRFKYAFEHIQKRDCELEKQVTLGPCFLDPSKVMVVRREQRWLEKL